MCASGPIAPSFPMAASAPTFPGTVTRGVITRRNNPRCDYFWIDRPMEPWPSYQPNCHRARGAAHRSDGSMRPWHPHDDERGSRRCAQRDRHVPTLVDYGSTRREGGTCFTSALRVGHLRAPIVGWASDPDHCNEAHRNTAPSSVWEKGDRQWLPVQDAPRPLDRSGPRLTHASH